MMESEQYQADKPEFVKYPKILALGSLDEELPLSQNTKVSVFEKVDGGNCQVRRNNGKLFPGSRGHYITGLDMNALDWFRKFGKWMYPNASLYNLPEDIIMFGEWSGNHTINYGSEFSDKFVFTDAWDLKSKRFMNYADAVTLLRKKEIKDVYFPEPLLECKAKNVNVGELVMESSKYYSGPKEGIVIKAYQNYSQDFFKAYHPDFAESRDENFGNTDHLTSVRFKKAYYGLREELGSASVPVEKLIETVASNVMDEHASNYQISDVRKRLKDYLDSGKLSTIGPYLISENK